MARIPETPKRKREYKGQKQNANMKFYNSKNWRVTSKVYRRKHAVCELSKVRGIVVAAQCVDHIIPIEQGGSPFDERNLMSLATSIHSVKTRLERTGQIHIEYTQTLAGKVPTNRSETLKQLERKIWANF